MSEPLRLFVLAGEPSGDRIGADLVDRLARTTPLELSGVGGPELATRGLASIFPMDELAVMGWADVLPRLPLLLWRARQTARAIIKARPDVVVLIDAQVFSEIVARHVRRAGGIMPILLYVAPAVWAWKPERAMTLKALFDAVLAVLPFEPEAMQRLGGPPTFYVGHPAIERFPMREQQPRRGPLLLLPGSRDGELKRHLPLMRAMVERFRGHPAIDGFLLPTPSAMEARVAASVRGWPAPVRVVTGEADKAEAFRAAVAAVAVTGTVTLELALAGVPMVATYLADRGQATRWQKYRVKYASLPNIVLDRPLVPEVLAVKPDPQRLGDEVARLLGEAGAIGKQRAGFQTIRALMLGGEIEAPREDPAARVLAWRGQRSAIGA